MKKNFLLTGALIPLLFACGDGESKKATDAALSLDSGGKLDSAKSVADAGAADGSPLIDAVLVKDATQRPDYQPIDLPTIDAPATDAPATDADTETDGGDALAADASGCQPSLPIVHVSQAINAATTWTTGTVYVIDQSIVINALLTIQPSVVVKFMKGPAFSIGTNGAIVADGVSDASRIVFTSIKDDAHGGDTNGDCNATAPAPGDWAAIKLSGNGSTLRFADFYYGGSSKPYTGVLSINNKGTATISNCIFAFNDGGKLDDLRAAALHLGGSAVGTVAKNNLFYANTVPVVINALIDFDNSNAFAYTDPTTKTVVRNTYNGIFMDGVSHTVSGAVTWSNIQAPYVLYQVTMSISDGGTLTVADGVVVKNYKNRIDVANLGTLTAADSASFTSFLDDSKLGDTNADGAVSAPTKGDWTGINVCKPLCKASTAGNILYASNI